MSFIEAFGWLFASVLHVEVELRVDDASSRWIGLCWSDDDVSQSPVLQLGRRQEEAGPNEDDPLFFFKLAKEVELVEVNSTAPVVEVDRSVALQRIRLRSFRLDQREYEEIPVSAVLGFRENTEQHRT